MEIPKKGEVRKPTKTLAGVTPVAVMCAPRKCKHGTCLYCPSLDVPQSYTPKSPPVLRASLLNYDPYEQIKSRLRAFKLMNHPIDKIELIIMGGNFLDYPKRYKENFIKRCFDALNSSDSGGLELAHKKNESARHRCVALCIETRPDSCSDKNVEDMLRWGVTRVEIGVQAIDDEIYKKVNRGHKVEDVILATKQLRDAGFKVGYHMMLGLPGSNPKKDLSMFKELFDNENFKPDQLKIYPCQVLKGAGLESLYKNKKYSPYTKLKVIELVIEIMKIVPNYCRVMRVMREIPPEYLVKGIIEIDLRREIEANLKKSGVEINEIRMREIGFALRDKKLNEKISGKIKMKISEYFASGGREFFLEFINENNILFGLCRLRIKNKKAIIREVHVYGKALRIGEKGNRFGQHRGLGKKLIKKAEDICIKEGVEDLHIISGVGVRNYYRKLSYRKEKNYMKKKIKK